MLKRMEMKVIGLVQGVGFRYFVYRKAKGLNVTGFVQNIPSGEVEVVAEGEKWELEELAEMIKVGPMGAHVRKFYLDYFEFTNEFVNFEIRG